MKKIIIMLSVAMMFIMVEVSHSELSDGLVIYYPFDGNTHDESGNGNNGIKNDVSFELGVIGQSVKFDGKTGYIKIPNFSKLEDLNVMTLTYWIKYNQTDIGTGTSLTTNGGDWPSPWSDGFFTYVSNNGINHYLGTTNEAVVVGVSIDANVPILEQCFTFIAFIVSSDKIKTFKNGKFVAEADRLNKNISRTGKDWYLGQDGWNRYYLNGYIDELRIYNRVISESEINDLYNEAGSFCESKTLYVNPILQNLPSTSGSTIFAVTSNLAWTIDTTSTWLTIQSDNDIITVYYDSNKSDTRKGSIIVSSENAVNSPQIIEIIQDAGNIIDYTDTDMDGVIDFFDKCSDTLENSYVDKNGCAFDFSSVYTQEELSSALSSAISEKNNVIAEKDANIIELNEKISTMFTQEQVNNKLQESQELCSSLLTQKDLNIAELNEIMQSMYTKEQMTKMVEYILLWGDTNNDGKIGLSEAVQALMITSGINE